MPSHLAAVLAALLPALAPAVTPGLPQEKARDIPEELKPWVPWVLHGAEAARCPFLPGAGDGDSPPTNCLWPSRLSLQVSDKAGSFEQQWRIFDARGAFVPLPGDAKSWPQDVRIDGAAAVISDQEGAPRVHVPAGEHRVTGGFAWSSQPESLQLPAETGLLALTLRGQPVELPEWEAGGKLFLAKQAQQKPEEDRLLVNVVRRLDDQIPAALTTELQLAVSGKSREVVIGPALLPGFTATSLESPLPVRLEADGRLRVQLRPGDWTVDLGARSAAPVTALTEPKIAAPWADETVWAFAADDELRQVTVGGVPAIDPQQTRLPEGWKSLPAYRMRPGDTLLLAQGRRGDGDPAPDALRLSRELWLDHDGQGYTVHDELAGELHQGWRLDAAPRLELGRVAVGGRDQLLTRAEADGPVGVEIRQGSLAVSADSRLSGDVDHLPAVGWQHDFKSVTEELHLPPGWRLFHATGVDGASSSWISSWALADLCLLLVAALAVGKLFGWGWGLAALLALGLSHHESGAPQLLWLVAIGLAGLARVLPVGKLRQAAELARYGAGALLVIALALFAVRQLRAAVFPELEGRGEQARLSETDGLHGSAFASGSLSAPEPEPADDERRELDRSASKKDKGLRSFAQHKTLLKVLGGATAEVEDALEAGGRGAGAGGLGSLGAPAPIALPPAPPAAAAKPAEAPLRYTLETDPNAQIQTGPGLTSWSWRSVKLTFKGPVEAAQEIRLYLVPPWLERLLGLLRVGLCALLAFCLLGLRRSGNGGPAIPSGRVPAMGALLLGVLLVGGFARAGEPQAPPSTTAIIDEATQRLMARKFPDAAMLDQLRARLLEKPACAPNCTSLQRMKLTATDRHLALDLELSAAADTAAPLPGDARQWRPAQVFIDGKPAPALWRDSEGTLWIEVAPGLHRIALEGPLPVHDSVQLSLPLKPHYTVADLHGWALGGLQDDGEVDAQLQLSRVARPASTDGDNALQPDELPGFALVTRTLQLGVRWTVHTQVARTTPDDAALVLEVPLLPGESVTSADVHVAKGKVQVNLPAGQSGSGWDSVLQPATTFELVAPQGTQWVEAWLLDASPIWRVTASGIPVVHGEDGGGHRLLEWRPWPGEKVTLHATRPAGVPGPTLTVDESSLSVTPGLRTTDSELTLELRSSRAGEHVITLPPGAELTRFSVDGQPKALHPQLGKVTVPLVAGLERVVLGWTEKRGPGTLFQTPAVDLGAASVNARTELHVADRWLLAAGQPGAMLGPVFLVWALFLLVLGAAVALARVRLVPLGTLGWLGLGLGFTQVPLWAGALFGAFLLAVGLRERRAFASNRLFNLGQVALAAGALAAAAGLFVAVRTGLVGQPQMFIAGNGSGRHLLAWYADRAGAVLPGAWLLSTPLWAYRAAMLAWAGGLSLACARLSPWAWAAFAKTGIWRRGHKLVPSTTP
jgi:hypothetical protein